MNRKLLCSAVLAGLSFTLLASAPAEARHRIFWWQQDQAYEFDNAYVDDEDSAVDEQFNQAEYDLYMRQMGRERRNRYVESYYDPEYDLPVYKKPPAKKVPKKLAVKKVKKLLPPSDKSIQTASLSKPIETKPAAAKVDCKKGASIVAGYGFSTVTTKSCTGATLVYGAARGGKNFEIQVSSVSGELTTVKKL